MNIEQKTKNALCVIGIKVDTSNSNESSPDTALIPGHWQQYFSENIQDRILNKTANGNILGVYFNYDSDHHGAYSLITGHEVSTLNDIPGDMVGVEIPQASYLVFTDEGEMPQVIYSMWQFIRNYFSENNQFHRQFGFDFERYNAENSSQIEIYISIIPSTVNP